MKSDEHQCKTRAVSTYEPSPEEILAICQAIRAGWTDWERIRRRRMMPDVTHADSEDDSDKRATNLRCGAVRASAKPS